MKRIPTFLARIAAAERAQQRERVEAGRMAALECDLDRVLADQARVLDSQLIRREVLDAREPARRTAFAATLRARARPAELFAGVGASVAILPRDLHDLADAVDVHREGKRIRVFQL